MSDKYVEIGEILAAARRQQGKTLKDASESTKIMENYLTAIETGNPGNLPSVAYFLLFARSYAQYLGIDPAIFEEIENGDSLSAGSTSDKADTAPDDPETAEAVSKAQAKKFGKSLIFLVAVILIVFVVLIVYNMFFIEDKGTADVHRQEQGLTDDQSLSADENLDEPELVIPDTPYQPPGKLKMYMKVKQDVWAMVVRDGDTVLNRRLVAGDERLWEADYRYHLTLGISTAVDLYVNDRKLAPLTERARTVAGLEINQVNYESFLPAPDNSPVLDEKSADTEQATPRINAPASVENQNDPEAITGEDTSDGN